MEHGQISWAFSQEYSNQVLAEGISKLRGQPSTIHRQVTSSAQGNYLISLSGGPPYSIGEAKALSVRTKQQFSEKTSTFYKTFVGSG